MLIIFHYKSIYDFPHFADEAEVFDGVFGKTTFIWMGIQTIFKEMAEDLTDMFLMIRRVIGINEDVVQVDDHTNIQEITEDVVHEMLENCRSIGKSEGHNEPFKRTIAGLESGDMVYKCACTDAAILANYFCKF